MKAIPSITFSEKIPPSFGAAGGGLICSSGVRRLCVILGLQNCEEMICEEDGEKDGRCERHGSVR